MSKDNQNIDAVTQARLQALESEIKILNKALNEAMEEAESFRQEFSTKRKQIVILFDTAARLSETDNLKDQLDLVAQGV
ncbi:MAG TPA: hypothetical protein ENN75_00520, partial [candidate division Zixibacteria bacterium]|nr:hypothetical protein [candidate division Zixibacteria bacterium]